MYVADTTNNVVRKILVTTDTPTVVPSVVPTITPIDIITTFAGGAGVGFSGDGGAATSASLKFPRGIAVDATGNVYIVDTFNNRIRKVTISTSIITTIAGSGTDTSLLNGGFSGDGGAATSAMMFFPSGVALDTSGNQFDLFLL